MEADFNNASLDDSIEMALFAAMIGKRHCLPGRVVSFDKDSQTIVAEPMISSEDNDGNRVPLPPVADVPLFQLGGGNFVITLNPKEGDPCLLLVSDRAIDSWFETGENRVPADFRQNDLSDCLAFVGFRPKPMAITKWMTGLTIRMVDGSYYINMDDSGNVTVKSPKFTVDAPESVFTGNVTINKVTTFNGNVNGINITANFKDATIAGISYRGHRHKENGDGGGITDGPQ